MKAYVGGNGDKVRNIYFAGLDYYYVYCAVYSCIFITSWLGSLLPHHLHYERYPDRDVQSESLLCQEVELIYLVGRHVNIIA